MEIVFAAVISGGVSGISVWLTTWAARRRSIEVKINHLEQFNRAQWLYIQELVNHIYEQKPPPPPEPPAIIVPKESKYV